ncbi:hypothetical protein TNIN_330611, partial [Trichonephila inaurata madagascariensis]
ASGHLPTARNRSALKTPPQQCFNGRSVTGLSPFLCPVKGLSVCLNVPRPPRPRPKP